MMENGKALNLVPMGEKARSIVPTKVAISSSKSLGGIEPKSSKIPNEDRYPVKANQIIPKTSNFTDFTDKDINVMREIDDRIKPV